MEMIDINHVLVREVWNGTWFTLSLAMCVALLAVAAHRASALGWITTKVYYDKAFQVSLALVVFIAGSCLRAGYIWLLLHCETFNENCAWIQNRSWVMTVAGVLAITGGLCVVRILSPPAWQPYSWILIGITAATIPILFYLASVT